MEQAQQFMGGLSQGHFLKIFHKEVSDDRTEWGDHCKLLACKIAHQRKVCRSEAKNVFTKMLAEKVKGLHNRHLAEQGHYVKTDHLIRNPIVNKHNGVGHMVTECPTSGLGRPARYLDSL
jgi:hypothetical protein